MAAPGPGPEGTFQCRLCGLALPASYEGQRPPGARTLLLLEECFILKDPFTSDKDKFVILGSRCSLCGKLVCVAPECSLFYSKRFCLPCVCENLSAFPQEIRQDLGRRHSVSKTAPGKLDSRT
ncbi:cysteine-rich DPF motif domain-containing protein 1 [Macrotis lagotis]|uniref:cysteine-rich DPF motif domain-containing protein 1 n=1 Tax=Macrotis lagotis TaxID=92651 RepID=UPI003D69F1E4